MAEQLSYQEIKDATAAQPLFEDKTWRLSPEAWPLSPKQVQQLEAIGQACLEFYKAVELLYQRSADGKNILRNRELKTPWVAEYLDRGKPQELIEHARHKNLRQSQPMVIRPDLLPVEDGFALTEVDSVPGGIGLTAFLNRLYREQGNVIGGDDEMLTAFYASLASLCPGKASPMIAILVSDEAATYRPEMDWLASELQRRGHRVYAFHPSDVMPLGDSLCADVGGNPEEIDIVYRFWELFDLPNIPVAPYIKEMLENGQNLQVTPPMRHFQEEKLNLALFHHHLLEDYWRENMSKRSLKLLKKIIPQGWIMDPVDLPPNAVLDGPEVGGKPIYKWEQLAEASQKERNLILKLSGYHENAWGARSVLLGSDASRAEWEEGIVEAIAEADHNLYILQEYRKPVRLRHPVYEDDGNVRTMEGRLRLCPYYFVEGDKATLSGILATFCPADKKIIHGMRDAALLPCRIVEEGDKSSD
ncbi:MAG: hypothetical protein E1N59_356 [Puniceicoccaceae bacterium 5H]|nr:MAG: hypothetical protein E1N59_356 [Puniceicoccaceae bacterium 5H]